MAKSANKRLSKSKQPKKSSTKLQRPTAESIKKPAEMQPRGPLSASAKATPTARPVASSGHDLRQRPTKQSRVIALLQSPSGASIAAIMKATGWQQHSVRGLLTGVIGKRLKLKLTSKKIDNVHIYRIPEREAGKASLSKATRRRS